MYYIGKLAREIYSCVAGDIATEDVVITDERIQHIEARHPGVYRSFGCYISEIVANPDYILQDERPATAMVLKEFFDIEKSECFRLALRLIAVSEAVDLKNSVITFIKVRKKEYNRLLRNKKILYKHE